MITSRTIQVGKWKLDLIKLNNWEKLLALPLVTLFFYTWIFLIIITLPFLLIALLFFRKNERKVSYHMVEINGRPVKIKKLKTKTKIFNRTIFWKNEEYHEY